MKVSEDTSKTMPAPSSDHQENKNNKNNNSSLIEQQFLDKLRSYSVAPLHAIRTISPLPLNHGFYDGIVTLLAAHSTFLSSSVSVSSDGSTHHRHHHQDSKTLSDGVELNFPVICEEIVLGILRDLFAVFTGSFISEDEHEHEENNKGEKLKEESEEDETEDIQDKSPFLFKWELLSYHGITLAVRLLVNVFTRFPNAFYTHLDERQAGILIHVLGTLLHLINDTNGDRNVGSGGSGRKASKFRFISSQLSNDKNTKNKEDVRTKNERIEQDANTKMSLQSNIVKILCLPFALELDQTVLYTILCSLHQNSALESLLRAASAHQHSSNSSNNNNKSVIGSPEGEEQTSIIVGLVARLVLTDEMFVAQLKGLLSNDHKTWIRILIQKLLFESRDTGVRCDVLAVLSHLARQSADGARLGMRVFEQDDGMYTIFNNFRFLKNIS